ncbi:cupin domain-containing protein [Streptomyces sp. NPDC127197]|uniref:cupin domain-containing protein n=2 Tax=unclassified Streptomyces TaxID=2593676 RepID=UPI00362FE404
MYESGSVYEPRQISTPVPKAGDTWMRSSIIGTINRRNDMTFNVSIPDKKDPRWTRRDGIFVRRGEGITKWLIGDTTTVKISAAQTEGRLGVLETSVPPGGGAVAHSHGREDEAFYILTGDFEFINGDEVLAAGPGDFLWIPRGNRHGFKNVGALPATLLTFLFPGGHEQFWIDNGVDPVPGEQAPKWGPEEFSPLVEELTRHHVTLLPDDPP